MRGILTGDHGDLARNTIANMAVKYSHSQADVAVNLIFMAAG
jgi:hypothetical protein